MLVHIDENLYFNSKGNEHQIKKFEEDLQTGFKVQLKGDAHWFLSMRITQSIDGKYVLDQSTS